MTDSVPPNDSELLSNLIGYNLRRGYFIATQLFTELFADKEITPIQFAVLNVLASGEAMSQKDVAAKIGSRPQALVPLVRNLEERGLVLRSRSQTDRRHHHLSLTADGRVLTEELNRLIPEVGAD